MKRLMILWAMAAALSSCSKNHPPAAELYNAEAATPAGVAINPIDGKVLTSSIDTRAGTMSTLYGNEVAAKSSASGAVYGKGAVLRLVTWRQQADPNWFGARIPAKMESVETVTFSGDGAPGYERRAGDGLKVDQALSTTVANQRTEWITGLRAAVMP